jgi:peptide/nickel transport system substrate-binding protein
MGSMALSRRSMVKSGVGAGLTAAAIASMTFPRSMAAQTPVGEIPPKTISGTAILAQTGEPQSFQPDYQADDNLWPIACNIYNSLFSLDNSFNVIPELATGYEVAEDGLSITVTLNPLATWHDGTPVTAADVKYTLEQIVADTASTASGLIGAVSSVEVIDDHTAQIILSTPSSSVIGFLSWYGVFILPAHIYEGTDWKTNPANQAPIGSGPFTFVSYEAGSSVELAANEQYFGEGPYLEKLIYSIIPDPNTQVQALQNGEIDYIDGIPNANVPTFENDPNFKMSGKVYPSPIYFGFNQAHPPLDNLDVRTAIGMAVDRDQILATALGGYGTTNPRYYPEVIAWASNPDALAPAFDVDGANALLDGAGFPMNGDSRGIALKLYHFTGWPEAQDTAVVVKEQLAAIGIEVELVALESAAWWDQVGKGEHDLGLLGGFQGPDPANLALRFGTDGNLNYWAYSNPEVDALLEQGDTAPTQEERAPLYFEAQALIAADVPAIPVVLQTFYSTFTSRLSGIWLDPDDPASTQVGMNRFTLAKLAE